MKVMLKKPHEDGEIVEVNDIRDINKLCANINKEGEGYPYTGSDIVSYLDKNVVMFCKEDAINNFNFEENLWNESDSAVLFGNVVFASNDPLGGDNYCSLSDEQIEYVKIFIIKQKVNERKRSF